MSFSLTDGQSQPAINATRLKRQLVEQAIAAATAAEWQEAAEINERIREFGPDWEAENRLAKAHWEQGELGRSRALPGRALDRPNEPHCRAEHLATSHPARRSGQEDRRCQEAGQGSVAIFVEETGKTGFAYLVDLADPRQLAQVNPGDAVELLPDGPRLKAKSNGWHIGYVEPRVAARLLKLIAEGNKYAAGVTSIGEQDVRIIIRETYQDPANYGKVSFPTAAKVSDLRPYTKGTLIREEMDLEEELELDEEEDEIEDIGRVVPDDLTSDEAFVEEESVDGDSDDDDD